MKLFVLFALSIVMLIPSSSHAQLAAQRTAAYLATLRAVMEYKINDEENLREVEQLRNDPAFNQRLERMLSRLQNTRTKDARNTRIQRILERAGRDVFNQLN